MPDPDPDTPQNGAEKPESTPLKKDRSELIRAGCTVGPYILGHTIGRGSFGKVKYAMDQRNGNIVAVKIVQKSLTDEVAKAKLEREMLILKMMEHPYVVKLHAILESVDFVFIVMENITGGELFDYIVAHNRVKEQEARRFFSQIVLGIEYCHSKGVVHRDLKPENLLLDSKKNIKVIDFGLSNLFQGADQFLKSRCGSPHYSAPEVVSKEGYTFMADIFSMGIILFSLLTGALPFDGVNHAAIVRRMRAEAYRIPKHVSEDACDLIKKMLKPLPSERATVHQIIEHPWLKVDNQKLDPVAVRQLKTIRESKVEAPKMPDFTVEPPTPKSFERRQSTPSEINDFMNQEKHDRSSSLPPGKLPQKNPEKPGRFQRLFKGRSSSHSRSESPVVAGIRGAVENITKGAFGLEYTDIKTREETIASSNATTQAANWLRMPPSQHLSDGQSSTAVSTGSASPESSENINQQWKISKPGVKKEGLHTEDLQKKSRRLSVPNAFIKSRPASSKGDAPTSKSKRDPGDAPKRPQSTDVSSQQPSTPSKTPTRSPSSFLKSIKDSIKHKRRQSMDGAERRSPRPASGGTVDGPSAYPGYGAFSQSATSTLPPKQITANVTSVLDELKISYRPKRIYQFQCKAQVKVFPSNHDEKGEGGSKEEGIPRIERIKFALEIFRLPRLNVHVVLYMRKQGEGDVWAHRAMCHKILSLLKI